MIFDIILYVIIFLYGIIIGSFLNVCIYRIPKHESLVVVRSHCMNCNHQLAWYDLFPLFSWLFLKGKCRYCGTKISYQYPLIEGLNGVLYVVIAIVKGFTLDTLFLCIATSVLLVISIIDFRTMLIPVAANLIILLTGIVHLVFNLDNWLYYVLGFVFSGLFLLACALIFRAITGKGGLGLGDVELMACAGLLIGWGHGLFAIIIGSLLGSIIQIIIMIVTKKKGKFPFGPYLSIGILISALIGNQMYDWYLNTFLIVQ